MRYDLAKCYLNYANQYVLFEDAEVTGGGFCATTDGSGVNEHGRKPETRYGDADIAGKRGNCLKKLCVNDKYN